VRTLRQRADTSSQIVNVAPPVAPQSDGILLEFRAGISDGWQLDHGSLQYGVVLSRTLARRPPLPLHMHLAQVNTSILRVGLKDPRMLSFMLGAEMIRRAAATAPGHVWNEQTHDGVALLISRSVWTSFEAFKDFAYRGLHARYMKRRDEWFVHSSRPSLALWWIPPGMLPTIEDALQRLELLRCGGPTAQAFDTAHVFAPVPDNP
jgi:hypothetical protein